MTPRVLITALVFTFWFGLLSRARTSADIIVYGSTPGGCCAAIAAAREGASVILLEPTARVGGMNTGGLCFSDSDLMYRALLMGLFHEWHLRIQKDYQSRGVTLPCDVALPAPMWPCHRCALRRPGCSSARARASRRH